MTGDIGSRTEEVEKEQRTWSDDWLEKLRDNSRKYKKTTKLFYAAVGVLVLAAIGMKSWEIVVTEEYFNRKNAEYCQEIENKYGSQALTEIYTPGKEETCAEFMEGYHQE